MIVIHQKYIQKLLKESSNTGAVILPTGSFDGELPIVLTDVVCQGNEESILQCPESTVIGGCESGAGAAVVCQGEYFASLTCYHCML